MRLKTPYSVTWSAKRLRGFSFDCVIDKIGNTFSPLFKASPPWAFSAPKYLMHSALRKLTKIDVADRVNDGIAVIVFCLLSVVCLYGVMRFEINSHVALIPDKLELPLEDREHL